VASCALSSFLSYLACMICSLCSILTLCHSMRATHQRCECDGSSEATESLVCGFKFRDKFCYGELWVPRWRSPQPCRLSTYTTPPSSWCLSGKKIVGEVWTLVRALASVS
jgi:hypothetical protein